MLHCGRRTNRLLATQALQRTCERSCRPGIDSDHAGQITLQTLNDCRSVGLIFDEHGTDGVIQISLSSNLGFCGCRIQVLVDYVENVSLATFDTDHNDGDVVGGCYVLEGSID